MKATVEIPDPLLEEARRLAARQGTTLRALINATLARAGGHQDRSLDE